VEVAKITSKGQITIPISIRRKLELNEGDKVLFIYKPEGVMMVNPNNMQGGAAGDIVEAAETEMASEAIAAAKSRTSAKTAPMSVTAIDSTPVEPESAPPNIIKFEETAPAVSPRPAPPPMEEEPPKPAKQVGGLDLGSLLDDIRSIGSNI